MLSTLNPLAAPYVPINPLQNNEKKLVQVISISNKILVPFVSTRFCVGGYWNVLVELLVDDEDNNDHLINAQNYVRTTKNNNNSILNQSE